MIKEALSLSEKDFGYEVKIREALSKIWLALFQLSFNALNETTEYDKTNNKIKLLMTYIYEHYSEKISISELASAAFLSERECFRVFREVLHTTPADYLRKYRLQIACQMLVNTNESISYIGHACGLGSSSYFGKIFRDSFGCTPLEYRQKYQIRQKR